MQLLIQAPTPLRETIDSPHSGQEFLPRGHSTAEIRWRVGAALGIKPEFVEFKHLSVSPSGGILHCTGTAKATRFRAKIYLADLYPVPSLFPVLGEDRDCRAEACRPVEEQISSEWKLNRQMRSLMGRRYTPTPLGYSLEGRTMVFEEVEGVCPDQLVRWAWPGTARLQSLENSLFHAGTWLRNLHEISFCESEFVTPVEVLKQARQIVASRHVLSTHKRLALWALEAACRQIGPRTPIRVPIAMNHGDFALPNLVWDGRRRHLWVVNFELASCRSVLHDLGMMVFDLRRRLLHPLTSQRAIRQLEQAFWSGYGSVTANLRLLVNAVATHRVFYRHGISISCAGQGRMKGMRNLMYKRLFQRFMIARILRMG